MTTTMNLTPSPATIALAMITNHLDDIIDRDSLHAYAYSFASNETTPMRDALIDIIDLDIRDLYSNANIDMIFPAADDLSDADLESLSDHIYNNRPSSLIADLLLILFP